jgi:hypothetical protein
MVFDFVPDGLFAAFGNNASLLYIPHRSFVFLLFRAVLLVSSHCVG